MSDARLTDAELDRFEELAALAGRLDLLHLIGLVRLCRAENAAWRLT